MEEEKSYVDSVNTSDDITLRDLVDTNGDPLDTEGKPRGEVVDDQDLIGRAVDAVKKTFNDAYDALMGEEDFQGVENTSYNSFRNRIFATDEFKDLPSDDDRDNILNRKLRESILKALGPMRHGENIKKYMSQPKADDNRILFGILKVLKVKRAQIQPIMENLAGIDKRLYEYVREGGKYADKDNVKQLIEALIRLQANALLALLEKEFVPPPPAPPGPEPVPPPEPQPDREFFDDLINDVLAKINEVNKLLEAKTPEERVGVNQFFPPTVEEAAAVALPEVPEGEQFGGSRNNKDLMKYMKYKAKYLKLKSKFY